MPDLYPLFTHTSTDEQDSVRLLSVDACVALTTKFSPELVATHVLPTVRSHCKDKSWRVRYMVADLFCKVSEYSLLLFNAL